MAATIALNIPIAQYVNGGRPPLILPFKRDTAETWSFGDFVRYNSATGKIFKSATSAANLLGIALCGCPLLVRDDLTDFLVLVFEPDLVVAMNAWVDNTSAVTNTIAQTNIGNKYDFAISGGALDARYVLDVGAAQDAIFQIEGLTDEIGGGVIGDIYPRVNVRLIASACQWA